MVIETKIELELVSGKIIQVTVTDYDKFLNDVRYRDDTTIVQDTKTGLTIFCMSIATFKKVN